MKNSAKIGYIDGINSYESSILRSAIEHYARDEFNTEPHIITASDSLVSNYKKLALSHGWHDELAVILRNQARELVAEGAEYIVTPHSIRGCAYDYIFDGIESVICLNNYARRLYLNLVPLLKGYRHGEQLSFIGPTKLIEMLGRTIIEEHTRGCDVPVANVIFFDDIDKKLCESLFSETEDDLHIGLIHAIDSHQRNFGVGHIAVTDFWTERILFGKERSSFDKHIFTLAPFETLDRHGCQPGQSPNIVRLKVYNCALIFARFVAWCSSCNTSRLKKVLRTK